MAGGIAGLEVLVTGGPTYEYIDDVRYIGNPSTGLMGIELADAARRLGGIVTLVTGPTHLPPPPGVALVRVVSADEMLKAVSERFGEAHVFIASAAVSDYRPAKRLKGKEKKGPKKKTLELVKNPDVLKTVTKHRRPDQVVVGFSLETGDLLKNGRKKLKDKRCDMVVVNTPGHFGTAREHVQVIGKRGVICEIPPTSKQKIAEQVLKLVDMTLRHEMLPLVQRFEDDLP